MTDLNPEPAREERDAEMVSRYAELVAKARREGLLSLDDPEVYRGRPFLFRLGLKLALEGTDPILVERTLRNFVLADARSNWLPAWAAISAIQVLQGSATPAAFFAHWTELLGPEFAEQARGRSGHPPEPEDDADDRMYSRRMQLEKEGHLSAMRRAGTRLACSTEEKRRLIPLFVWMVGAANRARKTGLKILESQTAKSMIPEYLKETLRRLSSGDELKADQVLSELEEGMAADEHSGIALVERSLAHAWTELIMQGAHPRLVFNFLAGFFGEAFYPELRIALRKRSHGKSPTDAPPPDEEPPPAVSEEEPPAEPDGLAEDEMMSLLGGEEQEPGGQEAADEPDGLEQDEMMALLGGGDEPDANDESDANDTTPGKVLSDGEINMLLNAVQEDDADEASGGGGELNDSAGEIRDFLLDLAEHAMDDESIAAGTARVLALLAMHLEHGSSRIASHLPKFIAGPAERLRRELIPRLNDPLEPLRIAVDELRSALTEGELDELAPDVLARLIESLPDRLEILELLEEEEAALHKLIEARRFVFEDLVLLDDRALEIVLKDVDRTDLAKAMKSTDEEVQEKILKSIPEREAMLLREDMEFMGPIRLQEVEENQGRITTRILELEREGTIFIARPGEDELVM